MDRGAWQTTVHGVTESDMTEHTPQERKIDWCTPNQLKMKHISPSLNP